MQRVSILFGGITSSSFQAHCNAGLQLHVPHTFTYALQPLASPPTSHLLHVVTNTSFAACSSASCGDIFNMLISTGPYKNTLSMPVHQVYPLVLPILLLSAGRSHTTSPLAMAGAAGSQLSHNLQRFHHNCFHNFKLLCSSLPSFTSFRLHNFIHVFV